MSKHSKGGGIVDGLDTTVERSRVDLLRIPLVNGFVRRDDDGLGENINLCSFDLGHIGILVAELE